MEAIFHIISCLFETITFLPRREQGSEVVLNYLTLCFSLSLSLLQVILKQQRVIKRLLKKCYGRDFCINIKAVTLETEGSSEGGGPGGPGGPPATAPSSSSAGVVGGPGGKSLTEFDTQNDSDSAIMLEDHLNEVKK